MLQKRVGEMDVDPSRAMPSHFFRGTIGELLKKFEYEFDVDVLASNPEMEELLKAEPMECVINGVHCRNGHPRVCLVSPSRSVRRLESEARKRLRLWRGSCTGTT